METGRMWIAFAGLIASAMLAWGLGSPGLGIVLGIGALGALTYVIADKLSRSLLHRSVRLEN